MGHTHFLSAIPSFMGGMASVLDMGATLVEYNDSADPRVADYLALYSDWASVGDDLNAAMGQFECVNYK